MFIINGSVATNFKDILRKHLLLVATSDVYYQNARLLNGHHELLDFDAYNKYYKNILNDIELVTEPVDAFIPEMKDEEEVMAGETPPKLFYVNRVGPEYEKIDARVTYDDLIATLPPEHPVAIAVNEDPDKLQIVKDDIYIYWSITKYLQKLDELRLQTLSNMTPAIEYVVKNVDMKAIKRHLHSKRLNIEKYNETIRQLLFKPDVEFTYAFYDIDHECVPSFDAELVMQKLITNIDCQIDSTVIVAMYLAMTFAISDVKTNNADAECVKYVRDVISKI